MTPSEQAAIASATAAAISAIAAVLAVLVAAVTVYLQVRWQRPDVKVTVTSALPVFETIPGSLAGSRLGDPMLGIEVRNRGKVNVSLKHAGLQLADGKTIPHTQYEATPGSPTLPIKLEPGDETTLYFNDLRSVARAAAEAGSRATHGYVRLGGGQEFTGPLKRGWIEGFARERK